MEKEKVRKKGGRKKDGKGVRKKNKLYVRV